MAGLPSEVLDRARQQAEGLKAAVETRAASSRAAALLRALLQGDDDADERDKAVESAERIVQTETEL